jgi:hypothetical protein
MSRSARPLEPDPEELEAQTRAVAEFVLEHLRSLDRQPSFDLDGVEELRASFRESVPENGRPLASLLERLKPAIAKSYNAAGPGYLAYIPAGASTRRPWRTSSLRPRTATWASRERRRPWLRSRRRRSSGSRG